MQAANTLTVTGKAPAVLLRERDRGALLLGKAAFQKVPFLCLSLSAVFGFPPHPGKLVETPWKPHCEQVCDSGSRRVGDS